MEYLITVHIVESQHDRDEAGIKMDGIAADGYHINSVVAVRSDKIIIVWARA